MFNKIKQKQLINFKYKGIKIGDLIYDTHLRLNFKPTININERKLLIFYHALNIFTICEFIFQK